MTIAPLLALLDVDKIDKDLYVGLTPGSERHIHLFGGLVAAQALRAAWHTVPEGRAVHAIHCSFLRRGTRDHSTVLRVDRDRDGASYSARRVSATQDGEVILSMSASFHVPEEGPELNPDPPLELWQPGALERIEPGTSDSEQVEMFDIHARPRRPHPEAPDHPRPPGTMWIKPRGPVGDDPVVHACLLLYVSDIGTGFADLDLPGVPFGGGPSLDHAVWFHRPTRVDDGLLLHQRARVASGGRGLYQGDVYRHDHTLVATVVQEVVLRQLDAESIERLAAAWRPRGGPPPA